MKEKRSFETFRSTTAALFAALVFLILSAVFEKLRVLFAVLAVAALAVGVWLLLVAYKHAPRRTNFFLYDPRRKRNIPEAELTFPIVSDRIEHYLAAFVSDPAALWQGIPKALGAELQAKSVLVPILAYKMLYDLCVLPGEQAVERFDAASDRAVSFICNTLKNAGDGDFADFLFKIKHDRTMNEAQLATFFAKNRRYLETRTMRYIADHLPEFTFTSAQ